MSHNIINRVVDTFEKFFDWLEVKIRTAILKKPPVDLLESYNFSELVSERAERRSDNRAGLSLRVARNIDWYLDAYPGLDIEEKEAVEDLVSGCPEYQYRFQEATTMDDLLQDAGALLDGKNDSETVGYASISEIISTSLTPKSIKMALTRFKRRLSGDADVIASYTEYQERAGIDFEARPAIDHFEEITGHIIRESGTRYNFGRAHRLKFWKTTNSALNRVLKRNGDRPAIPGRHDQILRAAASLANPLMIVVAVISVLYSVNYANQSPTERMAHIHSSDINWVSVGLSNRGLLADWELEAYERYEVVVDIVAGSRKSVFGLFRSYRSEDLYLAREILFDIQKDHRVDRRQIPEALLLLGKLNFLLGDVDKAIPPIRDASFQDGPAADEAGEFLNLFATQK